MCVNVRGCTCVCVCVCIILSVLSFLYRLACAKYLPNEKEKFKKKEDGSRILGSHEDCIANIIKQILHAIYFNLQYSFLRNLVEKIQTNHILFLLTILLSLVDGPFETK